MKWTRLFFLLIPLLLPMRISAQQQQQGVCARVKIEIIQELTLERIGFEATLEVTNNDGQDPITDFFADLTFEDPLASTNGVVNDSSTLFFVRAPQLEGIADVNGTGVIGPTKKAVVRWFIIPKIRAGSTSPDGKRYRVGARLSGKFQGNELPPEILQVFPDTINVKPEPQLEITYFQPRDVQGDDPFTEQVESPIPFTLGVLVKNTGYGRAKSVKINSQQPKIVENKRNLLLIAQLLGARVMDSPLRNADLLVNLGDLEPGQAKKGAWDMITSLSGEFVEFKASYTHASELGGEETSVITLLEAHFIAHEVMNDQPGRDSITDFLADTDRDEAQLPDALYESEGNVLPVNHLADAMVTGSGLSAEVDLVADREGWGYIRLTDPAQGRLAIERVVRSDGKVLHSNNVWTNIRYEKATNNRLAYLNLLDRVELRNYRYSIQYKAGTQDSEAPETTLHFAGTVTEAGGKFHITPQTQMFFISEDASPVSIVYSVTNSAFLPAIPFQLRDPGEYLIRYYATDSSNNREATKQAILVLSDEPPQFAEFSVGAEPIFIAGDALSIRPALAEIRYRIGGSATGADARVDIFQGVKGWPRVAGVPSSPTRDRTARLIVSGDQVNYFKYRLNAGAWSAEQPVSSAIDLSNLAEGEHRVAVLGRSSFGVYGPEAEAIDARWRVAANAPVTRVSGSPATPARERSARLTVSGDGVTAYRWTVNGSYYRAEAPVAQSLDLSSLTGTQQVVSVIGKVSGVWQPTNEATVVTWRLDPNYGSDFANLNLVRSVTATNAAGARQVFAWDGRDDRGRIVPPGWYTVRVTVTDGLGRTTFATELVEVGDLAGAASTLADALRGAKHPYARGRWVVWQDQSAGSWRIYGRDLGEPSSLTVSVWDGQLSQENPKTDGRYVVWQARQANGNWDIMAANLTNLSTPTLVTRSLDLDETRPAIEWPWIVFESRAAGNTNAPLQVRAYNLVTRETAAVSPSTQDQMTPDVQGGRVVWQDFRDAGYGEIYFKDLESGSTRRLTQNEFGQYHPVIFDRWIVWQDNRHGQVELYGFDLARGKETRVTNTPENEARPYLDGAWVVCEEDSLGVASSNLRLIHLSSRRAVPLTRTSSFKTRATIAAGRVVWEDQENRAVRILSGRIPAVQAVFANQNVVAVTDSMGQYVGDAYSLLALWNREAGVEEISRYRSLVPSVVIDSAQMSNGQPTGTNFALTAGSFLWVKFSGSQVLELGAREEGALNLNSGVNVLSYSGFPSAYSAFRLIEQLGSDRVRAVRMLDSESGRWVTAEVSDGKLVGYDFTIPRVAVVMIDLADGVNQWRPY